MRLERGKRNVKQAVDGARLSRGHVAVKVVAISLDSNESRRNRGRSMQCSGWEAASRPH